VGRSAGDLWAALLLTALTLISIFIPPFSTSAIRIALGLPFVLFLPGYALIAALFPGKSELDGIERLALSFGMSIAVVPLIGLALNYTPWGIRLRPVAASLSIFTALLTLIAYERRKSLPEEDRYRLSLNLQWRKWLETGDRADKALTALLLLSITLALVALIYVIATPKQGERFTEFYILGEKGLAADYPVKMTAGKPSAVRVGVVNREHEQVNYTLVVALENTTLLRKSLSLSHNTTWEEELQLVPQSTGEKLKLQFLLYRGNSSQPYRSLHLWVDVAPQSTELS